MSDKNKNYSAIIIGSGCLGASVFRALKLKGITKVLLIDKGKIGGGISSQSGGMVRVFHRREKDRMFAKYSQNVFYSLEKEIGLNISRVGSLCIISKEEMNGINCNDFEIISYEELKKRFPEFDFFPDEVGIYEKDGASICVKEYAKKLINHYRDEEDDILENTHVHKIDSSANGMHKVVTAAGLFQSPRVIVSSGLGLRKILPEIYEDESIEKREITTYRVQTKTRVNIPNFFDYTKVFYGTSSFQGAKGNFRVGVKSGTKDSFIKVKKYLKKRILLDYEISEEKVSASDIYTKSRDGFVGEVCGRDGVYVLAGWGGGAFKFSPFLGNKMVEHITSKKQMIGSFYENTI